MPAAPFLALTPHPASGASARILMRAPRDAGLDTAKGKFIAGFGLRVSF